MRLCPFCKSVDVEVTRGEDAANACVYVMCNGCAAEGPPAYLKFGEDYCTPLNYDEAAGKAVELWDGKK